MEGRNNNSSTAWKITSSSRVCYHFRSHSHKRYLSDCVILSERDLYFELQEFISNPPIPLKLYMDGKPLASQSLVHACLFDITSRTKTIMCHSIFISTVFPVHILGISTQIRLDRQRTKIDLFNDIAFKGREKRYIIYNISLGTK